MEGHEAPRGTGPVEALSTTTTWHRPDENSGSATSDAVSRSDIRPALVVDDDHRQPGVLAVGVGQVIGRNWLVHAVDPKRAARIVGLSLIFGITQI